MREATAHGHADAMGEFASEFYVEQELVAHTVAGGLFENIKSEFAMAGAADGYGELRFVGGEYADAFSSA
jgi:hypothetical protein